MRFKTLINKAILCLFVLVLIDAIPAFAQDTSKTKVIIIKETYDEHGNKTVQRIEKEGAEADAIDIERLAEGHYGSSFEFKGFGDMDQNGFFDLRSLFDSLDLGGGMGGLFDSEDWPQGFNFMPFNMPEESSKPKLGVRISELELQSGVLVTEVMEDSPAEKAGLKVGDIILAVNTKEVDSPEALVSEIQSTEDQSDVVLDILRDEEHMEIIARLETMKAKPELEIRKL